MYVMPRRQLESLCRILANQKWVIIVVVVKPTRINHVSFSLTLTVLRGFCTVDRPME